MQKSVLISKGYFFVLEVANSIACEAGKDAIADIPPKVVKLVRPGHQTGFRSLSFVVTKLYRYS
jgi:hypothetical protein